VTVATALPDAVVFDCDGTIVDTEPLSRAVLTQVLLELGYEASDEDFAAVVGTPGHQTYAYFSGRLELPPRDDFRTMVRSRFDGVMARELRAFDDAVEVIAALATAGVPLAVTSSSSRSHVERALGQVGLLDHFAVRLGAGDVAEHKPAPEPYLAAARGLGIAPERCVAIEDSAPGVASATAAGMFTVGVTRGGTAPALLAAAHRVVDRLAVEHLAR